MPEGKQGNIIKLARSGYMRLDPVPDLIEQRLSRAHRLLQECQQPSFLETRILRAQGIRDSVRIDQESIFRSQASLSNRIFDIRE
jgi:hypothetical protein